MTYFLSKKDQKYAKARVLLGRLSQGQSLSVGDFEYLLSQESPGLRQALAAQARKVSQSIYGHQIFFRGIVEFSNICQNNCYYCGIRRGNRGLDRYRLSPEEIFSTCKRGYDQGYRTFVLQSGEDPYFTDEVLVNIIRSIKGAFPDVAVTLSLGVRSKASYQALFEAGADRYLLRHETADPKHFAQLHPPDLTLGARVQALRDLREIGFDIGAGMMVGAPYQTFRNLAQDLVFIQDLKPEMCGIGPFIPHQVTPFRDFPAGSTEMTLYLLSIIRLVHPRVLLPATTALGTTDPKGRVKGILAGANVIMPNLSPVRVQDKYQLYNRKLEADKEEAGSLKVLEDQLEAFGYQFVVGRGDYKKEP